MPKMLIVRALPGAGKSTLIRPLEDQGWIVASPDRYPGLYGVDKVGNVTYDVTLADPSHGSSFRTAIDAMRNGQNVAIDATNLTTEEVVPYVSIAQAYRASVLVLTLNVDAQVAFARNVHGVPRDTFFGSEDRPGGMVEAFEAFEAPFHWQFLPWLSVGFVGSGDDTPVLTDWLKA